MNEQYLAVKAELERPFDPALVRWKPQATSRDGKRALAVAYVDARTYARRLDEAEGLVPGCEPWQKRLEVLDLGDRVGAVCHLTVAAVTRFGDGECLKNSGRKVEPNAVTSASAQAFKRACVAFGLGRYLYGLPEVWVDYDPTRGCITAQSLARLRRMLETGEVPGGGVPRDARAVIVRVGDKHRGKSLGDIAIQDPEYVHWLAENWNWAEGRRAAGAIWRWLQQQAAT